MGGASCGGGGNSAPDATFLYTAPHAGSYSIDTKGLPDGTYTVQAWQEYYHDSAPQQVEVKGGKASKLVNFVFQAKSGKAEAKPQKEIHLASADEPATCCADGTKVATK
jgi:hypothetical protein